MDFAIVIGIDEYINLSETPYAENDAREFARIMHNLFGIPSVTLLLGKSATYMNIDTELQKIENKIDENDKLMFFFAGHGENFNGVPHISCFDSSSSNKSSWHSLASIIERINHNGCNKSLYFIDACESTLKLGSRKVTTARFNATKLKEILLSTTYTVVFSACSHKGVADVNEDDQHGIWSSFLLKALRGEEEDALTIDRWLTNSSLQNYLTESVKTYCKTHPDVSEVQHSHWWGKAEGDFLIREYPLPQLPVYNKIPQKSVRKVRFIIETTQNVRNLSGFKKGSHKVPQYFSDSAVNFINSIANNELKENIDTVCSKVRTLLKLKRKDYQTNEFDGTVEFKCMQFDYSYSVELQKDDLSIVKFISELTPLDPDQLMAISDQLDSCFPEWFDFLVFPMKKAIDMNKFIDNVEAMDEKDLKGYDFSYDNDCTEVTLHNSELGRTITIHEEEVRIRFHAMEPIPSMLDGLLDLSNQLLLASPEYKLLE